MAQLHVDIEVDKRCPKMPSPSPGAVLANLGAGPPSAIKSPGDLGQVHIPL